MKKIVLTVTTDLVFDQRMRRICGSLSKAGYDVLLVGRKKKNSPPLNKEPFQQLRLKCIFEKGKLFYTEYNIRLFFFLLNQPSDVICGIDLDTLLPAYLVAKLRRKPIVYDAHEYFTEMEEVVSRPLVKMIWKWIERIAVPNVDAAYTVSNGYSDLFQKEYKTKFSIVRNVTVLSSEIPQKKDEPLVLYQGAVNYGRGVFNVVRAMENIDGKLMICGMGDIFDELQILSKSLGLESKITFAGYIQPAELLQYTRRAKVGLTIFEADGLSNKYSLANRFFDYFHSGVPQIAMSYPDYKEFNSHYEVASLIDNLDPFTLSSSINRLLKDDVYYSKIFENTLLARQEVNWQNEEKVLLGVYQKLFTRTK